MPLPVVNTTDLVVWTVPWKPSRERDTLTVVVKATCDLVADAAAKVRPEAESPTGAVERTGVAGCLSYPSDFAIFKPKADVLVVGHAHPTRRQLQASSLHLRIGHRRNRCERNLAAFGPRYWSNAGGMSEPQRFEPIQVSYANAFGGPGFEANPIGIGYDGRKGADGLARLPFIESPAQLIKTPRDMPAPACFAPIPMRWSSRWRKLGSYDQRWLDEYWPYFPADFDWTFYQSAPPAQQLAYLSGDEPFELAGFHPTLPTINGRLPALAPRVFAKQTAEAGGDFIPLEMNLDTVVFDTDEMKLNLVWRGLLTVSAEHAPELAALYLMRETLGGAKVTPAQAEQRFIAEQAAATATPEIGLLHSRPTSQPSAAPVKPHEAQHQQRAAARRAAVVQSLRDDSPIDRDLQGADLSGPDLTGRSLAGANLLDANLRTAKLDRVDLTNARLLRADLMDASLTEAILDNADLSYAILEGADLTSASLAKTKLATVNARRANFTASRGRAAQAQDADFRDAQFTGAHLPEIDLTACQLDRSHFAGAELGEARLYDATAQEVVFDDAALEGLRANDAKLSRCSFRNTRAARSLWDGAQLDGSSFMGAILSGASFNDASLTEAVLSTADLRGAQLRRAKLQGASLLRADLMKASLEGANLAHADLRAANLAGAETWKADLKGAKLDGAHLYKSKLGGKS